MTDPVEEIWRREIAMSMREVDERQAREAFGLADRCKCGFPLDHDGPHQPIND